ncbi:MAG: hypothetical protein IJ039_01190, partial [Clostridia bacterium]|nr:hypothetical protein [Clostridia bacterium]
DAGKVTYCFCGYEMSKEAVEGTALSHDYDYLNNEKAELISFVYTNYSSKGVKTVKCAVCGENGDLEASPLFECQGYSASNTGNGISLGFKVNQEALNLYNLSTGNTVKYGVFAVSQKKLGEDSIFDKQGNANSNAICANIAKTDFTAFDIKVIGFENDTQKDTKFALGAYVAVTNGESTEYSYMQAYEPTDSEKYSFMSFNEIIESLNL